MQMTVAEPAAIYVDPSCGDDRADGTTPATAIASLERLESFVLGPGTRVLFRAGGIWYGSYHPVGGGLPQQPVIITRYGVGPDPILCGTTESSTVYIRNMSHLVLERLEITHSCRKTDRPLRGVYLCYGGEGGEYRDICLRDLYIHDIGGRAQREAGGLVIWADTAERPVTFSRLTVAGCTICDQAAQGITFSSVYSYRTGIDWTDKPYAPSRDIRICDNYIARCGGDGIFQSCADDPVLEHNTVTGCCFAGNTAYAGIWPHNSQRPVMRGNESFGNRLVGGDGQGYDVDINCTASRREFLADMASWDVYASALVTAPSGDPQYFFTTSCVPGMSYNFGAYDNPEVTALIEELSKEFDTTKRGEIAVQLQQMILDDNAYVFCSFLQMNMISKENVKNYTAHACDYYQVTVDLDIE